MIGTRFTTRKGDRGIRNAYTKSQSRVITQDVEPTMESIPEGEERIVMLNGVLYSYRRHGNKLFRRNYGLA